jgi:hypothetical protein
MTDDSPTAWVIRCVKAQALREAADAWIGRDLDAADDPVAAFLRERADSLEAK